MDQYRQRYKTAHVICNILEIAAWLIVAAGVITALVGFATGGLLGAFSHGTPHFVVRLMAAVPGVAGAVTGLFTVLYVQHYRAVSDTAEMTRELLFLARRQAREPAAGDAPARDAGIDGPKLGAATAAGQKPSGIPDDAEQIGEHKGVKYYKKGHSWYVEGDDFGYAAEGAAKIVINHLVEAKRR